MWKWKPSIMVHDTIIISEGFFLPQYTLTVASVYDYVIGGVLFASIKLPLFTLDKKQILVWTSKL